MAFGLEGSGQGHAIQSCGLLNTSLPGGLADLRTSLPECILPSWVAGNPSYSQETCPTWQGECSKTGVSNLL